MGAERQRLIYEGKGQELHRQLQGHDDFGIVVPEAGQDERRIEPGSDDAPVDRGGAAATLEAGVEPGERDDRSAGIVERTLEAEPVDLLASVELEQLIIAPG